MLQVRGQLRSSPRHSWEARASVEQQPYRQVLTPVSRTRTSVLILTVLVGLVSLVVALLGAGLAAWLSFIGSALIVVGTLVHLVSSPNSSETDER